LRAGDKAAVRTSWIAPLASRLLGPICQSVLFAHRRSCSRQSSTPLRRSRLALARDHPWNPFSPSPNTFSRLRRSGSNVNACDESGIVWVRRFFVRSAVIVHSAPLSSSQRIPPTSYRRCAVSTSNLSLWRLAPNPHAASRCPASQMLSPCASRSTFRILTPANIGLSLRSAEI
jgi:hypothetical protein